MDLFQSAQVLRYHLRSNLKVRDDVDGAALGPGLRGAITVPKILHISFSPDGCSSRLLATFIIYSSTEKVCKPRSVALNPTKVIRSIVGRSHGRPRCSQIPLHTRTSDAQTNNQSPKTIRQVQNQRPYSKQITHEQTELQKISTILAGCIHAPTHIHSQSSFQY